MTGPQGLPEAGKLLPAANRRLAGNDSGGCTQRGGVPGCGPRPRSTPGGTRCRTVQSLV